jgi:hypothetical protein
MKRKFNWESIKSAKVPSLNFELFKLIKWKKIKVVYSILIFKSLFQLFSKGKKGILFNSRKGCIFDIIAVEEFANESITFWRPTKAEKGTVLRHAGVFYAYFKSIFIARVSYFDSIWSFLIKFAWPACCKFVESGLKVSIEHLLICKLFKIQEALSAFWQDLLQ